MIESAEQSNKFKFDELLLFAIDEAISYVFGETNASIIYRYLEANSCTKEQIPQNLEFFSSALRDLIGNGRGQMLGAACMLEETIAEAFAMKLNVHFAEKRPFDFPEYIKRLRQTFSQSKIENRP